MPPRAALQSGIHSGQVRPDIELEIATDMIAGAVFARYIGGGERRVDWADAVLDMIFQGIAGDGAGAEE